MLMARVDELKSKMLGVLDYAPKAKTAYQVEKEIGGNYTEKEYGQAADELQEEKKIQCVNDWWVKRNIKTINLTKDDLEWLTGTGYYGQG